MIIVARWVAVLPHRKITILVFDYASLFSL